MYSTTVLSEAGSSFIGTSQSHDFFKTSFDKAKQPSDKAKQTSDKAKQTSRKLNRIDSDDDMESIPYRDSKPTINQNSKKPTLLLIEDVDVLLDQDRGLWSGVLHLVETSKRPIILVIP